MEVVPVAHLHLPVTQDLIRIQIKRQTQTVSISGRLPKKAYSLSCKKQGKSPAFFIFLQVQNPYILNLYKDLYGYSIQYLNQHFYLYPMQYFQTHQ